MKLINKYLISIKIQCDVCNNFIDIENTISYSKANYEAKKQGWHCFNFKNEWFDVCSNGCKNKVINKE